MHEALVLISILLATILWGILGALIIVPVLASLVVIVDYLRRRILGMPPFPSAEFFVPQKALPTGPEKIAAIKIQNFQKEEALIWLITFSIVAPIFNELENIPELYRRVRDIMSSTHATWELILVDDGSSDGSTEAIRALAQQDKHVRPVIFARNFGHQVAITAGWDYARGEAVVIMDADLQDPPEVIPDLIAKWREGYEVVYAVRAEREGETWFKEDHRGFILPGRPPHHRGKNPRGYG